MQLYHYDAGCPSFLADRAAAGSMIGYWHDTVVCLCVCLSVTMCVVALRVGVGGHKSCSYEDTS